MTLSGSQSATDMANLKFPRRELPGKLLAIGAVLLMPKRQPKVLASPVEVQPKFKIGDAVAEDWVGDDDVAATEFGEVLGMRYLSEAQSCFPANSWIYYINWTHSTTGLDFCYPNYDGEGSRECDLRLVKQY